MEPATLTGRPPRAARVLLRTQTDSRVAALAGDGSEAAFEELVRRYRSLLVAFAGRVASAGSADDVVQEAMLRAHSALKRGDRPETPRAWLFQIVRRSALNERRGWKLHEELDETIDGVEQPQVAFERRESLRRLVSAVDALPGQQRRAILARELEGRGHEEIAASLGVSAGAVRQLIFRARSTLRAGFGAMIPVQLLRVMTLSSGAEPSLIGGGAGGLGLGAAAKFGLGAALSAGAIAVAPSVSDKVQGNPVADAGPPASALAATRGPVRNSSRVAPESNHGAARGRAKDAPPRRESAHGAKPQDADEPRTARRMPATVPRDGHPESGGDGSPVQPSPQAQVPPSAGPEVGGIAPRTRTAEQPAPRLNPS